MTGKVLVGCVTFDGHGYCLKEVLSAIKKLNRDILFVDNSKDEEYSEKLKAEGVEVIRDREKFDFHLAKIVNGRNIISREAIKRGYDYVFFVDTDVVVPSDSVEKMLKHNKDIITGVYIARLNVDGKMMKAPVLYGLVPGMEDSARMVGVDEILGDEVFEIAGAGLGCCLIKTEVLDSVEMKFYEDTKVGDDIYFYETARKKGYKAFVDTSVKCEHHAKDIVMKVPEKL